MGFLLGAYGKLAAGSRYRSLQARMMRIQSKIRRATRDVADMEKLIDRRQKMMEQELQASSTATKALYQQSMQNALYMSSTNLPDGTPINYGAAMQALVTGQVDGKEISNEQRAQYSSIVSQAQQSLTSQISQATAFVDTNTALNKSQLENQIEMMRDQLLEPLKDEEDSLQLEKDTLESQIQVAKADYEACQKMEQSDAQMMKPNYTGGQG